MDINNNAYISFYYQMPEMDGIEATERIRKELNQSTVPIVALTADVLLENREKCLAAGNPL